MLVEKQIPQHNHNVKEAITGEDIYNLRNLKRMYKSIDVLKNTLDENERLDNTRLAFYVTNRQEPGEVYDDEFVRVLTIGTLGIYDRLCRNYRENNGAITLVELPQIKKLANNILKKERQNT